MPHADGGPSRNHEDHVPALKQVFADPPVLVGLDLDGPVIEKIGHHVLHFGGASLGKPAHKRLRAEDNDGAALDHDLAFALIVIEKLGKILALHAPDALMHAFHRDQAVHAGVNVLVPGVFHIYPGNQGTGGPQDDAVLVKRGELVQNVAHLGDDVERLELQLAVAPELHAETLADKGYFLAVCEDIDILALRHGAGCLNGPFDQRHARELLDQLIRDDGVFLDGRDNDAAFFHAGPPEMWRTAPAAPGRRPCSLAQAGQYFTRRSEHIFEILVAHPGLEGEGYHGIVEEIPVGAVGFTKSLTPVIVIAVQRNVLHDALYALVLVHSAHEGVTLLHTARHTRNQQMVVMTARLKSLMESMRSSSLVPSAHSTSPRL